MSQSEATKTQCPECGWESQDEQKCERCGRAIPESLKPPTPTFADGKELVPYAPSPVHSRPILITIFNIFGWIVLVLSVMGGIIVLSQDSYDYFEIAQAATGIGTIVGGGLVACFLFWMAKVLDLLADIRDRG